MPINQLSIELLAMIFLQLYDASTFFFASQVCQKWRDILRNKITLKKHVELLVSRDSGVEKHVRRLEELLLDDCYIWNGNNFEPSSYERSVYLRPIKGRALHRYLFRAQVIYFESDSFAKVLLTTPFNERDKMCSLQISDDLRAKYRIYG
jgi:hypothetical protein